MPRTLDLLTDRVDLSPAELPAARIDALYVHVPFCFHKCHYCDFYSITRQTPERMERFVDLLLAEADLWSAQRPTAKHNFLRRRYAVVAAAGRHATLAGRLAGTAWISLPSMNGRSK